ncbi:MAG: cytochrome C peroxidase [Gammaproteobacteria bacterium]|nr:cytochrome C peroxidase [Gammaproteobacteria bacterium]MBT5361661.1 cytochrome C peroxidase [Gammaproteobacteria bacterium]
MIPVWWLPVLLFQWLPLELLASEVEITPQPLIELGRQLFHDTRLSKKGDVACSHCHNLQLGGQILAVFRSIRKPMRRNAPSIYNVVFNFRQTWDGRAQNLAEQIDLTMATMGAPWQEVATRLQANNKVAQQFQQLFGTPVTREGITQALVAFQKTLTTLDAPYDRYRAGDSSALTEEQHKGLLLFESLGCNSCHDGEHLGGTQFQSIALFFQIGSDQDLIQLTKGIRSDSDTNDQPQTEEDHDTELGDFAAVDTGRYEVTGRDEDHLVFKVPNVALTAPYFHNGSSSTLDQAIFEMAEHQLGIILSAHQTHLLVEFLKSLTSEQFNRAHR